MEVKIEVRKASGFHLDWFRANGVIKVAQETLLTDLQIYPISWIRRWPFNIEDYPEADSALSLFVASVSTFMVLGSITTP